MQVADPQQLLECLSAQQLLNALKMLKKINVDKNQQLELSFNQSSTSLFNTMSQHQQQQQHLDFQLYMAKKNQSQINNKKFTKKPHPQKTNKKPLTPTKSNTNQPKTPQKVSNQCRNSISQIKSRSHSPIVPSNVTPRKTGNNNAHKTTRKEKQNIPEIQKIGQKISDKSRQILQAKSRKGDVYIPIHQRQGKVIKEKQEKIAKLQRMNLTQLQLEQRECTFKPMINEYKNNVSSKVSTHNASFMKNRRKEKEQHLNEDCSHFEDSFNISHSYTKNNKQSVDVCEASQSFYQIAPTVPKTHTHSQSTHTPQKQPQENKPKKYKNSKFNILLDLIH